jgi:hypothetical protein
VAKHPDLFSTETGPQAGRSLWLTAANIRIASHNSLLHFKKPEIESA